MERKRRTTTQNGNRPLKDSSRKNYSGGRDEWVKHKRAGTKFAKKEER